jgi:hypothetical protein
MYTFLINQIHLSNLSILMYTNQCNLWNLGRMLGSFCLKPSSSGFRKIFGHKFKPSCPTLNNFFKCFVIVCNYRRKVNYSKKMMLDGLANLVQLWSGSVLRSRYTTPALWKLATRHVCRQNDKKLKIVISTFHTIGNLLLLHFITSTLCDLYILQHRHNVISTFYNIDTTWSLHSTTSTMLPTSRYNMTF